MFGDQEKYPGLGALNVLVSIRVYGADHPSNMDSSVFELSVFLRVFSVFVPDGYHKHVFMSHLASKS